MKKLSILILFLFISFVGFSQTTIFFENCGTTAPSSPTYPLVTSFTGWANYPSLSFSNGGTTSTPDVRSTLPSPGSGSDNVWFTSTSGTYGFSIENIQAQSYTSLKLKYLYSKESATSFATFSIDYWNGSSWISLASSASALFNESSTASAVWYTAKTLSLPSGASINGLKIRFIKSGSIPIRIDDIQLIGTCINPIISINPSSLTAYHRDTTYKFIAHSTTSFNWQDSTTSHTWANITSGTSPYLINGDTLKVKPVTQSMNGFKYRILASNGFCSTPSAVAVLNTSSTLPVTLIYFTATKYGNSSLLRWSTASEINNDFFEVQRSTDAIGWEPLEINREMENGYEVLRVYFRHL